MKNSFLIYVILIGFFSVNAQEKKKDTIVATEIVNIETKYNPKIADANKIKNNPTIKLLEKSNKKKLEYTIFSAPVASTFVPKTGVLKGIDVGVKERIYNNYFAGGYGNFASPYAELFIYKGTRFDNEYGVHAKYSASAENVRNTVLNSNFLNFNTAIFFKKETRYFDWKVSLDAEKENYNWYGLPSDKVYTETTIRAIDEAQNYNYVKLAGDFNFHDSYFEFGKVSVAYFTDAFKTSEIFANFETKLNLPLDFLSTNLNDISINSGIEVLSGTFKNNYDNTGEIKYNLITAKLAPEYKMEYLGFSLKAGLKTFVSLDVENDITNFFIFPDIFVQTSIFEKYIFAYSGFNGDLETNTYKKFTDENPYVAPTLLIKQTATSSNLFFGLKGNISRDFSYHVKASTKKEANKPLFLRNNSKSNGTNTISNGEEVEGYAYGNSFKIYYDDVSSTSLFAEVEYQYDKNLLFSAQIQFDNYTATNALENWNLPSLQSSFSANYKEDKWYATANIYYVDERKDALYNATIPSSINGVETLSAFIDVNLNGGYHFNDRFSTFLRLNNLLNTEYQRFANFETQGFQVLGGITYKFDF
jgi:hypothetical protein